MSDYKTLVELAGKVAGTHAFRLKMAGLTNGQDLDSTLTARALSEAFGVDEEVVKNDILWCQEAEFERLMREQDSWTNQEEA